MKCTIYSEQFLEDGENGYRFRFYEVDRCVWVECQNWDDDTKSWQSPTNAVSLGAIEFVPDMCRCLTALLDCSSDDI